MKDIVFVTGHKNPDTDSICSAIAYADLLFKIGRYNAVPVRLGEINRETEYILKRFNTEIPVLLKTVKQKVEDLEYDKVTVFSKELTLKTAWELMKQQNLKSAPVLDDHSQLLGLLSTSNIIEGYMDEWDSDILKDANTPIENVIDTLAARVLYLDKELKTVKGRIHIAAMTSEEAMKRIEPGDVVIVGGDRDEAVKHFIEGQVSLSILTGSLTIPDGLLQQCIDNHISVISTSFNTFMTSQQIIQSIPVEYVMQKGNITSFTTDDTVDYVKEVMSETRFRSYPVLDFLGRVVGSISRFQVLTGMKKKVVQVDHNERGQSIDGIEEAEILEIIDHHNLGNITTNIPVNFRNMAVGSTCTIVYTLFKESNIDIPKHIAGALLSGILSDTLLLKSPTATTKDIVAVQELSNIAGVDYLNYGLEMLKAGTSLEGMSKLDVLYNDFKLYTINEKTFAIGQFFTMNFDEIEREIEEYIHVLDEVAEANNYILVTLFVTDIINNGSYIIYNRKGEEIISLAYEKENIQQGQFIRNCVSRKKHVVPLIMDVLEG